MLILDFMNGKSKDEPRKSDTAAAQYELPPDNKPHRMATVMAAAIGSLSLYIASLFAPGSKAAAGEAEPVPPTSPIDPPKPPSGAEASSDETSVSDFLAKFMNDTGTAPVQPGPGAHGGAGFYQFGASMYLGQRNFHFSALSDPQYWGGLTVGNDNAPSALFALTDDQLSQLARTSPQPPPMSSPVIPVVEDAPPKNQGAEKPPTTSSDDGRPDKNTPPVITSSIFLGLLFLDRPVTLNADDLLDGARDPDGDALTVGKLVATSGDLAELSGGEWRYTPTDGDVQMVRFTYVISDGLASVSQSAEALVATEPAAPILGTAAADSLTGTDGADIILGLDGNDHIRGQNGDDTIYGGEGNDHLVGGQGRDTIHGGGGDDTIYGNQGSDLLWGDEGNDTIFGGAGNDIISGDAGDDRLDGGTGDDYLSGAQGNDILLAGTGNDTVSGGQGNDDISLGAGDDIGLGDEGDDIFRVDDVDLATGDDGNDLFDGGDGHDTIDMSALTAPIAVDLDAALIVSAQVGVDSFRAIEAIVGGTAADTFTMANGQMVLTGGDGEDTYQFNIEDDQHLDVRVTDFAVGDRIRIDQAEFHEREAAGDSALGGSDAAFADIYFDQRVEEISLSDRLRFELAFNDGNSDSYTLIRIFQDGEAQDFVIHIDGHHEIELVALPEGITA